MPGPVMRSAWIVSVYLWIPHLTLLQKEFFKTSSLEDNDDGIMGVVIITH